MKNNERKYEDYWFNYCIDLDPNEIKEVIEETYIMSNEIQIHLDIYDTEAQNSNPTIIFIHGTAVYSRFYSEFLYTLYKRGFRVIAMDLPGHGMSEGRRGHFNMEELVATVYDVVSYVRENYSKKIVVIGSSLGGITTLYAAANDSRISACICVNAALLDEKAHKKLLDLKGILKLAKIFVPFLAKLFPRLKFSVWLYLDPKKLVKNDESLELVDILLNDELISSKYSLKALATQMNARFARPVENIETPIMIINGSDDVLFSVEYMQEIINRLKNSRNKRLEIIEDSSHLILNENREECVKRILNWFKSLRF